jgi:hypothetical protein
MRGLAGWPNYGVDERGAVYTYRYGAPVQLLPYMSGYKVFCCTLQTESGERLLFRPIHELVCEAFHGPRPAGMVAVHKSRGTWNNSPGNVKWVNGRRQEGSGFGLSAETESRIIDAFDSGCTMQEVKARFQLSDHAAVGFKLALTPERRGRNAPRLDSLTERRLTELLEQGYSVSRIACELEIDPRTVAARRKARGSE